MKPIRKDYLSAHKALHRYNKDEEYERRKQIWITEHPEATSREYEKAIRQIAVELGI